MKKKKAPAKSSTTSMSTKNAKKDKYSVPADTRRLVDNTIQSRWQTDEPLPRLTEESTILAAFHWWTEVKEMTTGYIDDPICHSWRQLESLTHLLIRKCRENQMGYCRDIWELFVLLAMGVHRGATPSVRRQLKQSLELARGPLCQILEIEMADIDPERNNRNKVGVANKLFAAATMNFGVDFLQAKSQRQIATLVGIPFTTLGGLETYKEFRKRFPKSRRPKVDKQASALLEELIAEQQSDDGHDRIFQEV